MLCGFANTTKFVLLLPCSPSAASKYELKTPAPFIRKY
ncbi:hypothetical protein SAMN05444167_0631 [Terriglobus roseus]|uniref:Uncharacterized protein n=1 Tax=Terriglobus roseus TaxID=392734 RepID=A0A1G7GAP0_9BACT|nr:hypothetical protein SAMN05444167_0631 [Terriglobus roseus]